jgi:hypothetical protein
MNLHRGGAARRVLGVLIGLIFLNPLSAWQSALVPGVVGQTRRHRDKRQDDEGNAASVRAVPVSSCWYAATPDKVLGPSIRGKAGAAHISKKGSEEALRRVLEQA